MILKSEFVRLLAVTVFTLLVKLVTSCAEFINLFAMLCNNLWIDFGNCKYFIRFFLNKLCLVLFHQGVSIIRRIASTHAVMRLNLRPSVSVTADEV